MSINQKLIFHKARCKESGDIIEREELRKGEKVKLSNINKDVPFFIYYDDERMTVTTAVTDFRMEDDILIVETEDIVYEFLNVEEDE